MGEFFHTVGTVDLEAVAELAWPPPAVVAQVRDLAGYPAWLGIVHRAVPDVSDRDGATWLVDLGARLGPLRRSKRVRMVRMVDSPDAVSFERIEGDGRLHSPWVLTARIDVVEGGSRLTMHLHYGGRAWLPLVELALRDEIRRAGARLSAVLEAGGA